MKSLLFAIVGALATLTAAVPTPPTYALHEKRSSLPKSWVRGNRVESDSILPVRIGLTQNNLENGYTHLMDV